MSTSDQDIYDAARAAILALTLGNAQSYTLPTGVTVTRLDLDKLRNLEREYGSRIANATHGVFAPVQVGGIGGPTA